MKLHRAPLVLSVLAVLGVLGVARPEAFAQTESAPEFQSVQVGVGRAYKLGLWTQATLSIRGGSRAVTGRLWVVVPDGDGVESRFVAPEPCRLEPGQVTEVTVPIRPGRAALWLRAGFEVEGRLVAEATFDSQKQTSHLFHASLAATGPLYLTIEPLSRNQSLGGLGPALRPARAAQVYKPAGLPRFWYGYEGFEAVFLCTDQADLNDALSRSRPELAALEEWVRMGGTLVLSVGTQAEAIMKQGGPLADLVPGTLQKMVTLRRTGALETYAHASSALPSKSELQVPQLGQVQGVVEARDADLPLVVRTQRGLGQVVFVAVDLNQRPVADWSGRPQLVRRLLDLPVEPQEESGEDWAVLNYGVFDLAGQLRQALDHFPSVRLVPFWLVAAMLAGYLILIGPVDYFFLRRFVGRMELTWITFPVLVLAVCIGVYALGHWAKGSQIRLNQAELIDVDQGSGLARGTVWADLFSPEAAAYDLSAQPALPGGAPIERPQWIMSWLGLPGQGLGGMGSGGIDAGQLWDHGYEFSPDLTAMQGVPVSAGGTKSLTLRWTGKVGPLIRAELHDEGQAIAGPVTNGLPFELSRAVLIYRQWAYELGDLAPGQSLELGGTSRRSELKTYLTGRRLIPDETSGSRYRQVTDPWDKSGADIPLILRTMMFYEVAGGQRYTGLPSHYQSFVDLSLALLAQRAVLLAQAPAAAGGSQILASGRPAALPDDVRVTLFRFLIPVAQGGPVP